MRVNREEGPDSLGPDSLGRPHRFTTRKKIPQHTPKTTTTIMLQCPILKKGEFGERAWTNHFLSFEPARQVVSMAMKSAPRKRNRTPLRSSAKGKSSQKPGNAKKINLSVVDDEEIPSSDEDNSDVETSSEGSASEEETAEQKRKR